MLRVHPSRAAHLQQPDRFLVEPDVPVTVYIDSFGNLCSRFVAPAGSLRLHATALIGDSGEPDPVNPDARQVAIEDLPSDVLRYLLASRYCESDLLSASACELFGNVPKGWQKVQAICDWVHDNISFGYPHARPTKSAMQVYNERLGVCRDFQHLAITFCRAMNIPARYAAVSQPHAIAPAFVP